MAEPGGAALPAAFRRGMLGLLGEADFRLFMASFGRPRVKGLRLNPAKTTPGELAGLLGVRLEPVPWCPTGFVFPPDVSLGGHPAHLAGLFYLQEPSAMAVVQALEPAAGWSVIDLAASPGGKTTHLASLLDGGPVVANEVVPGRLRPLHDNLDLWGSPDVVTMNRRLEDLAGLGGRFDAAVLDAPCSGEGLFRRAPASVREWSPEAVRGSARRQRGLLERAARLVRPGGVLVYSTCTFELAENEERVADFLSSSPGWTVEDCARWPGVEPGRALPPQPTERTARLWPHRVTGEGQFVARLRRTGDGPGGAGPGDGGTGGRGQGGRGAAGPGGRVLRAWQEFHRSYVPGMGAPADRLLVRGDRVFLVPGRRLPLPAGELARPGLPLGQVRPGRFEPHHALATAMSPRDAAHRVAWTQGDPGLAAFLRGETVPSAGPDGWVLVCFERWGLAWARRSGGTLKNMLPAHLRRPAGR
jgi:16S rRNA C967 or C1407 C5-methylase (RsmB/RsmF family)/NOL1/NOP2/fmu family ribosome biogenesis protein